MAILDTLKVMNLIRVFDLDAEGNTLNAKMNQWEKDEADYDQPTNVLVDFIDQSTRCTSCGRLLLLR